MLWNRKSIEAGPNHRRILSTLDEDPLRGRKHPGSEEWQLPSQLRSIESPKKREEKSKFALNWNPRTLNSLPHPPHNQQNEFNVEASAALRPAVFCDNRLRDIFRWHKNQRELLHHNRSVGGIRPNTDHHLVSAATVNLLDATTSIIQLLRAGILQCVPGEGGAEGQPTTGPIHLHTNCDSRWFRRSGQGECQSQHEHLPRHRSRKFSHRSGHR